MEKLIYLTDKKDAMWYYNLLKENNVEFRLRPYIKGFGFWVTVDNS